MQISSIYSLLKECQFKVTTSLTMESKLLISIFLVLKTKERAAFEGMNVLATMIIQLNLTEINLRIDQIVKIIVRENKEKKNDF